MGKAQIQIPLLCSYPLKSLLSSTSSSLNLAASSTISSSSPSINTGETKGQHRRRNRTIARHLHHNPRNVPLHQLERPQQPRDVLHRRAKRSPKTPIPVLFPQEKDPDGPQRRHLDQVPRAHRRHSNLQDHRLQARVKPIGPGLVGRVDVQPDGVRVTESAPMSPHQSGKRPLLPAMHDNHLGVTLSQVEFCVDLKHAVDTLVQHAHCLVIDLLIDTEPGVRRPLLLSMPSGPVLVGKVAIDGIAQLGWEVQESERLSYLL